MAYGDGSITKVRRGVYRVRVDFGKDPDTGKRLIVSRNVKGTLSEARDLRDRIRNGEDEQAGAVQTKGVYDGQQAIDAQPEKATMVTFAEYVPVWSDQRRLAGRARESTIEEDQKRLAYVSRFVGDVPLDEFTPALIESLYATIKADKEANGVSFGSSTLNKLHGIMKSMFKKAVRHDIIPSNPFDRVDAPKVNEPQRRTLTKEEAVDMLKAIDRAERDELRAMFDKEARQESRGKVEDRSYLRCLNRVSFVMAVRLGLATGMRLGEVLALTWGGIDFSGRTLKVYQALGHGYSIKPPKTRAGVRTIALDAKTVQHLARWKRIQKGELAKIGVKQTDDTTVVVSQKGTNCDRSNFEHWWGKFRKETGFPGLKFHELRHTQASQLLANGVDVKTVQTRLGHSNASLTLNWYAHALPENDRKAADMLGELFSGKQDEHPRIIEFKSA